MTQSLRKSAVFTLRLTREQKDVLKRVAAQQKKRPSDFLRDLLMREVGRLQAAA